MARAPEPVSYLMDLGLDGDRFDLDQQPGKGERLYHHCRARRRIVAKDFGTRGEHIHELGGVVMKVLILTMSSMRASAAPRTLLILSNTWRVCAFISPSPTNCPLA